MEKIATAIMVGFGLIMGMWFSGFAVLVSHNPHGLSGNIIAAIIAIFWTAFSFIGLGRMIDARETVKTPMYAAIVAVVIVFALRLAGILPNG